MNKMTRRDVLKAGLGASALGWVKPSRLRAAPASLPASRPTSAPYEFALPMTGKVRPLPSADIRASPLSVGFEVLDRKLFDPDKCYPHLAKLGVKWARCQTGWARTETTKGRYDFQWLDDVVDSLRKIGIQPWFNFGYGNPLYSPGCTDPAAVGWIPIFSDEARRAWVAYTRQIAEHFKDRVTHWEIWNEPNIANFWKPSPPSAGQYVEFVKLTVPEIRKIIPKAVVIGAALAGMPMPYLKECLDKGLADHVDKISYHPYQARPEAGYEKNVKAMRDLVAGYKKGVELWQGENGCPSQPGGAGALAKDPWDQTSQAKWALRRILSDLRLGLELTSYFHTVDLVGYRGSTNYKGLLEGKTYSPKKAYYAYQNLCALLDSASVRTTWPVRIDAPDADAVWSATFVRGGRAICAYWYPADLLKGWTPRKVNLTLACGKDAKLDSPVLVDTLNGTIYRVQARSAADGWAFPSVPLLDYPLLLADQAAVSQAGTS
jgi:hypothetical protein